MIHCLSLIFGIPFASRPAILQKNRWTGTPTFSFLKSTLEVLLTPCWNIISISWIFTIFTFYFPIKHNVKEEAPGREPTKIFQSSRLSPKFTQLPIYWHHNLGRSPIDFWWWADVVNNIVLYGEIQNATLRKYVPRISLLFQHKFI